MERSIKVPAVDRPIVSVDDDPQFQELLRFVYRRSTVENEVIYLSSGIECLDHMNAVSKGLQTIPAILLIDINMPLVNGFEVVRRLRENALFRVAPYIAMLSCSSSPIDKKQAKVVGADEYYEKPMRINDLSFVAGTPDENE